MFLYWRKRGAYELQALPSALAGLELGAGERFSWSSTLDIIEGLGGRCAPPSGRTVRRFPDLACPGASLWPEPVPGRHAQATVTSLLSSGVETRALLRPLLEERDPNTRKDPEGLGGGEVGLLGWAVGAPTAGPGAGQPGRWASGLGSTSVLYLTVGTTRREGSGTFMPQAQDTCRFPRYPLAGEDARPSEGRTGSGCAEPRSLCLRFPRLFPDVGCWKAV